MKLTQCLEKCKSPRRVQYERSYPVPFKEVVPITLRDRVSNKVMFSKDRPCVPELSVLLQCFKDSDFNQLRCSEALKTFNACIGRFNDSRANVDLGTNTVIRSKQDLTPAYTNKLLKNNPLI